MDIFELYKKLNSNGDWIKPSKLRQTRKSLYGMTQVAFADLLNISSGTYISWEQGRYTPSTPSQALLHIVTFDKPLFLKNRRELLQKVGEMESG
jgi:DNA-binding transcriptional regulator YiaG